MLNSLQESVTQLKVRREKVPHVAVDVNYPVTVLSNFGQDLRFQHHLQSSTSFITTGILATEIQKLYVK